MVNSSKPRYNLKAKTPAIFRDRAISKCREGIGQCHSNPLPCSSQCTTSAKTQLRDHRLFWVIPTLRINQRASWNSWFVLLPMQERARVTAKHNFRTTPVFQARKDVRHHLLQRLSRDTHISPPRSNCAGQQVSRWNNLQASPVCAGYKQASLD